MLATLHRTLGATGISYRRIRHSLHCRAPGQSVETQIMGRYISRTTILTAVDGFVVAALPAPALVDMERIPMPASATLRLVTEEEVRALYPGCVLTALPPFGNMCKMPVFVDSDRPEAPFVIFRAGDHIEAIQIGFQDYRTRLEPTIAASCAA